MKTFLTAVAAAAGATIGILGTVAALSILSLRAYSKDYEEFQKQAQQLIDDARKNNPTLFDVETDSYVRDITEDACESKYGHCQHYNAGGTCDICGKVNA